MVLLVLGSSYMRLNLENQEFFLRICGNSLFFKPYWIIKNVCCFSQLIHSLLHISPPCVCIAAFIVLMSQ